MARITVEDCLEKIDSQYDLVMLAKERTSQLNAGDPLLVPQENDKHTVVALREIAEGKISVKTFDDNLKNNDFSLFFSDKILIKGSNFDSTNLPKILNQSTNSNIISKVNKDIMIDIKDIKAPLSEKLRNFNSS